MKRLALGVLAAALLWSGYWFWQARATQTALEAWFDERRAAGWDASYSGLSVRGYPNRIDVTMNDLSIIDASGQPILSAPTMQIFKLVYNPTHHIIAFPSEMTVRDATVISDGLRASVVTEETHVDRANLEAATLNIARPDATLALAGVTLGAARSAPNQYRFGVNAQAMAGPDTVLGRAADGDGFALQAEVLFDADWPTDPVAQARPQPRSIDLRRLEYQLGTLRLKVAGQVNVDDRGRGDGSLTVRAENWRALIAQTRDAGQLPSGLADAMLDGLGLVSALQGSGETLDLPLRLEQGRVMLGPVPLGHAPLIRLP